MKLAVHKTEGMKTDVKGNEGSVCFINLTQHGYFESDREISTLKNRKSL